MASKRARHLVWPSDFSDEPQEISTSVKARQPKHDKHACHVEFPSDSDESQDALMTAKATWPSWSKTPALSAKKLKIKGKDRVRASDCDPHVLPVIKTAIEIYRALLLTENPYPAPSQECIWVKAAMTLANPQRDNSEVDELMDAKTSLLVRKPCNNYTNLIICSSSLNVPRTCVVNSRPKHVRLCRMHMD